MKKLGPLLLLLLTVLTGCAGADVPAVEDCGWTLSSVQGGENGQVVACEPNRKTENPSAAVLEMECTAQDGTIALTDRTNGKTYTGTYALDAADPETNTYSVTLEGEDGLAVCGNTTFYDGSTAPTFIINFGDYVLNFTAAEAE